MSYHVIDISTNGVVLSSKHGQLVCASPDGSVRQLPMEDVGAVLVNCFTATFHGSFLLEAAKRKVAVIVCEKFRPVSLVLPVQRASDTLLTRAQIQAPPELLTILWQRTVDAKCANQYALAEKWWPKDEPLLGLLRTTLAREDLTKEGNCARLYWKAFSGVLSVSGFRRLTDSDGLNALLNYGYAVLMLRVEQRLLALGLDPLYGIGHAVRERSLPLAYDLMEPFRPIVDEAIVEHCSQRMEAEPNWRMNVDQDYKRFIHALMERKYPYLSAKALRVDAILGEVLQGFRAALVSGREAEYKPWIRRSSGWAG